MPSLLVGKWYHILQHNYSGNIVLKQLWGLPCIRSVEREVRRAMGREWAGGAQGRGVNSKGIWGSGGFVGTQDYLSSNIKSSKTLNKILKNETLSYIARRGKQISILSRLRTPHLLFCYCSSLFASWMEIFSWDI